MKEPLLVVEKPKFVVRLYDDVLDVDLKEGARREFEHLIEDRAALRKSLGFLFQTVYPSDIPLSRIGSVEVDDNGQLKIIIPRHVDILIPLEFEESWRLAKQLRELVPRARAKKSERRRLRFHLWWPDFYEWILTPGYH